MAWEDYSYSILSAACRSSEQAQRSVGKHLYYWVTSHMWWCISVYLIFT